MMLVPIYIIQGRWEEAKKLFLEAMKTRKAIYLGTLHVDTALSHDADGINRI